MAFIDRNQVQALIGAGEAATTTKAKGDAFEDLICYLFSTIPGISVTRRNVRNVFDTEEIDVAFWNDRVIGGLPFLPWIILVECKNWSVPVGSEHVSWFDTKMRNRGVEFGVLFAAKGVTGNPAQLTDAHSTVANALKEHRRMIILTKSEALALTSSEELVLLFKEKLCELAVRGAVA